MMRIGSLKEAINMNCNRTTMSCLCLLYMGADHIRMIDINRHVEELRNSYLLQTWYLNRTRSYDAACLVRRRRNQLFQGRPELY